METLLHCLVGQHSACDADDGGKNMGVGAYYLNNDKFQNGVFCMLKNFA